MLTKGPDDEIRTSRRLARRRRRTTSNDYLTPHTLSVSDDDYLTTNLKPAFSDQSSLRD